MKIKRLLPKLLITILLLVLASTNIIQVVYAEEAPKECKQEINQETLTAFFNNYFTHKMKEYNTPGVCIAVVKDNKELFKAGYGYSNVEKKIKCNPDITTFPACSVSKLFTATAIMQLYESGKIDLHRNVEDYCKDIKINNSYPATINCNNLLTHSSGLDEGSELCGGTLDKNKIKSQQEYFKNHTLNVIVTPDSVSRYSNIGYNLLGYLVEKVSKTSYENYVKNNIFKPLQMEHSSVRLNDRNMANGYMYLDGNYEKMPFAYQYTSGSSGVITTVEDMEHFMLMHLNNGTYHTCNILKERTETLMHKKEFANDKVFAGMSYGFIRSDRNGVSLLKHEGALPGYTTTLLLFPNENLGIYVATNSLNGLVFDFEDAFLNYFYPNGHQNAVPTSNSNDKLSKYIGTYRTYDGISEKTIMKLNVLFDNTMDSNVYKDTSGTLKLMEYTDGKVKIKTKLTYQSKNVFLRADHRGFFTFRENSNQKVVYAFNDTSHKTFEKISWFESRFFLNTTLCLIFMIWMISIFIIIWHCRKRSLQETSREGKQLYIGVTLCVILNIVGFIGTIFITFSMVNSYNYSSLWLLKLFLSLLLMSTFLFVYCLIQYIRCIIRKQLTKKNLIFFGILIVSNLAFIGIMQYFNLLGYHIF